MRTHCGFRGWYWVPVRCALHDEPIPNLTNKKGANIVWRNLSPTKKKNRVKKTNMKHIEKTTPVEKNDFSVSESEIDNYFFL